MQLAVIAERHEAVRAACWDEDRIPRFGIELHGSDELDHFEGADGRVTKVVTKSDAEKILGCPVAATIPNDYAAVRRATSDGSFIDKRSDLGKAYLAFSRILTGAEAEKNSFMGLFRK